MTSPEGDEKVVQESPVDGDSPQVFGRYLLLRRLSRGGMGEIFLGKLGEIQGFEKPVIIKKILPHLSADQEFVKRFIDEAQVAIKLNHANVAAVYEVGKVDGDYFLALEYVEGRDLRRLLMRCREERFRLPPDLCLYIARELASGLGYAHRRTDAAGRTLALVHCDISPPNVMVSFEGEVKVIDFGIAKSAIRIAGSNPNIGFGKFGYMAPEQLIRGGVVDRRTDIYAAGVVLYELLTGERLFQFPDGADYKEIARIVARGEFVPPSERSPGLDPSLDGIVCKALATKVEARYQTAEEFRDAIQSKLSQMNPTISADQLAHLLRELFADDIEDERALIASTKDFDISDFRDELTGSLHHTVTYARAGLLGRRSPSGAYSSMRTPTPPQRRRWAAGALAALIGSVAIVVLLVAATVRYFPSSSTPEVAATVADDNTHGSPATAPVRPPAIASPPAPVNHAASTVASSNPSPPVLAHPVVTALPSPRSQEGRNLHHARRRSDGTPAPHATASLDSNDDPGLRPHAPEERPRLPDRPSDEAVVAKFRTVKREYDSFRSEYGPRLESEWDAITSEITFGKPGEKNLRLNSMLDSFRRDMSKIRTGG